MIGDEPDRRDRRVGERTGRDIEKCHCEHVARLGPFDMDRTRERVDRSDLRIARARVVVRTRRIEIEVTRVARFEQDHLAGLGTGRHGDGGMQAIDTVRILTAVASFAAEDDDLVLRLQCCGRQKKGQRGGPDRPNRPDRPERIVHDSKHFHLTSER